MRRVVENILLFQLAWLAVVLLGTGPLHWLGPVIAMGVVWRHLALSGVPARELKLAALAFFIGLLWESSLTAGGVLVYPQGQIGTNEFGPGLAPVWIVFMWPMMATTLNVALAWFHQRLFLASLFGAIGGPLAFLGGERLGAVVFPDSALALMVLAMGWSVLFPLLVLFARRLNGAAAVKEGSAS